jgi:hypothetical protein
VPQYTTAAGASDILGIIASLSYRNSIKLLVTCAIGLGLLVIGFTGQAILASTSIDLWYLHHCYLNSDDAVDKSEDLINKAVAAGYTGAVIWDSNLNLMGGPEWNPDNAGRLKEVMKYAQKKHLKTVVEVAPFGWSNDALTGNPSMSEAQRVVGAQFQVTPDGHTFKLKSSLPPLVNGDFSSSETGWFAMHDPNIAVVPNAYQGRPAVTITNPTGNARLRQQVTVHPWHQYHLSLHYKATGSQVGGVMVNVYDAINVDKVRSIAYLGRQDSWKDLDYLFNSADSPEVAIYMGVWGAAKGAIQFADVRLEETALVWVAHREGAPFKLYDPADPSKVYVPGVDYNEPVDPQMLASRYAFHNAYHGPPTFTLPAGTHLKPGQIVAADYYAVNPIPGQNQVAMCMTDPGVFKWLSKNAESVRKITPAESGVLLEYDEILQANSCASCRAKNMTAGELLAWNFAETFGIYRQTLPDSPIWVWNDMFDPYHNAHDHVMLVEGSFAGSWKGLPPEVGILNWNLDALKTSLAWFSGLNPDQPVPHPQIIAGFYDRGDGATEARREVAEAAGVPNVRGLMYTTWNDDYSKLKAFADAARAAWPDYLKSVPAAKQ